MTVDAIFEATVQVLLTQGLDQLTTTRVAARAGVSVGTLYQYFPNKQSLLYALNEHYLDVVAVKVETCCARMQGACLADMVEELVGVYWQAKMERADLTRALYRSVAELDNDALIEVFARRTNAATEAMLRTASDARHSDTTLVTTTLLAVIFGTVRNVFERDLPAPLQNKLRGELAKMCLSYLKAT
ncbi:TetR/AcrR family transcriptional regulator [Rhizobium halophilum]|uniref:TetR/AcrR family transcriptional regulator n=1 Tax=Rhizobium halophilum TaxID=2846852 RepID=UPI001EFE571F|nr:TetR/AcrR family transcriptional regulator [Rhizobium halophilum]MCF6369697.1 TetR/AcrR family transcriptional regulator [Rhizobium halophilum]